MPEWFRRKSQNIKTKTRKDTKEGMWIKCPSCEKWYIVIY